MGWEFPGGEAVANTDNNRLQLLFDEKPSAEQRTMLKQYGFHWSPSEQAWQWQLNGTLAVAHLIQLACHVRNRGLRIKRSCWKSGHLRQSLHVFPVNWPFHIRGLCKEFQPKDCLHQLISFLTSYGSSLPSSYAESICLFHSLTSIPDCNLCWNVSHNS